MRHEIVLFENGSASVRNTLHGEAMHSMVGPAIEAQSVYIAQTRVREFLRAGGETPFTIYDLGLGIGANALAAIRCQREFAAPARALRVISFESDMDGLRMALGDSRCFPEWVFYREAIEELLARGHWSDERASIEWTLRVGDFLKDDLEGLPPPSAVFFDFYSPKVTPELWGFHVFDKLRKKCAGGRCILSTYSAATRVRSALLLAGFFVGRGQATSAKIETTVATTRIEDLEAPLGDEWFEKFNRSARSMPEDLPTSEWEGARQRILEARRGQAMKLGPA